MGTLAEPRQDTAGKATARISLLAERTDREEIERRLAAGETPIAAWTSWERIEMPRAMLYALGLSLCALLALIAFVLVFAPSPRVKYLAAPTLRDTTALGKEVAQLARTLSHQPGGIQQGLLLAGNSIADLGAARRAAQQYVRLRYAYTPDVVNRAFLQLTANATPSGARALAASIAPGSAAKIAVEQVILGDSGVLSLREFGTGAYSYGVAPGVVRVAIPLVGRLRSRHFPYDGALSGLPVYENALVTVRKGPDARWRFDAIEGGTIDSAIVAAWTSYHFAARPVPAVVIDGQVVQSDSVWARAVARGVAYRNQH